MNTTERASLDASEAFFNYGFTLKHTGKKNYMTKDVLIDTLNQIIKKAARYKFTIAHKPMFELDSQDRLHLHTILKGKKNAYIRQMPGWHIHLDPLKEHKDLVYWTNYINKSDMDENETLIINEARHKYLFDMENICFTNNELHK